MIDLHSVIVKVMPAFDAIRKDITVLTMANPGKTPEQLSKLYTSRIRNKYASVGAVTALPGVIPGIGTLTQIAAEAGAVSADVALMLRWMGTICYGTGLIYQQDVQNDFEDKFTLILGLWSGVIVPEEIAKHKDGKLTISHFDKHISARIKNRMNQKIGQKLVTKYGAKRSGAVLGRLIPFGVGAVVGGTFNYLTIEKFAKCADNYFSKKDDNYIVTE